MEVADRDEEDESVACGDCVDMLFTSVRWVVDEGTVRGKGGDC